MKFEIELTARAQKFLKKRGRTAEEKIYGSLKKLRDYCGGEKLRLDVKKLKGKYEGFFRLRCGNYRLIFCVRKERNSILIIDIDDRKDIY